jgi:acetoin utilization deacetylase AcuC-like enzyme
MQRRDALRMLGLGATALAAACKAPAAGQVASASSQPAAARPARSAGTRVRVCYTPSYVGSAHAFETTRKAAWVAESLASEAIPGIELVANTPLTEAEVAMVHDPAYVTAVRTGEPRDLAQSQGFIWDPELWHMVLASNGGVVAAAANARLDGVAGSLSSGLHHAHRDHGAGFCTFNGLAIAALRALDEGAKRVLIIDLDAHCGGGTHSLIYTRQQIHQLDVAVDNFDFYQPDGRNTLDLIGDAELYLPTIERRLDELANESFDLCLYNAGMDPFEYSLVGGLAGINEQMLARRERMVFDWCREKQLPVAFVLAGGYLGPRLDQAGLVALHRMTLAAAAAG